MKTKLFLFLAAGMAFFSSCDKSNNDGKATLQVYLADDPADYDEVNIVVKDVQVNMTTSETEGWQSLEGVEKKTYNLLDLVDGNEALLVNQDIPAGKIEQIRLVLESEGNTIVVDGVENPLETPSADQSGLKLNIHHDVEAGLVYKMILDFDAAKSVVEKGNGGYSLKPVIRTVLESVGGSLRGVVAPLSEPTHITVWQGATEVAGTYTNTTTGGYWIGGLPAGNYDLKFDPTEAYKDTTRTGIVVTDKQVNVVDTMKLATP